MPRISVATYNVHHWIGSDGRRDPNRVLGIVRALDAQIVALQEVTYPTEESWQPGREFLGRASGMRAVLGPTLMRGGHHFGNVLLTSCPLIRAARPDLTIPGREPRGAVDVVVDAGGVSVRVIATHLGRRGRERRHQVARLLELFDSTEKSPLIMMGDFNMWNPRSSLLTLIHNRMGHPPALRTYPSRYPTLRLDRIWVRPKEALKVLRVYKTPASVAASDHLPLVATLELDYPE